MAVALAMAVGAALTRIDEAPKSPWDDGGFKLVVG